MAEIESVQDPLQETIHEVIYHCHICMEAFVCEDTFRLHMENHTAERPFECYLCSVRFINEVHLNKHIDIKHAKGEFYEACSVCGKLFHDKINLKSHMAVHSDDRPFTCHTCGKSFKRKGELESHNISHTGLKPYKCNLCSRAFTQRYTLKTHMRTHTGEKPFKCTICGKEFNRSSTVTLHMRQHTGEKPYQCTECSDSFKFLRDRKRHMTKVHGKEEKPKFRTHGMKRGRKPGASKNVSNVKGRYECAVCRMIFDYVMEFNDHIKTHDVDVCYLCGQKLKTKAEKRRHVTRPIKMQLSECFTCGLKFKKLSGFKLHMKGHSELCRLEECLRNAENLHIQSKKFQEESQVKEGSSDYNSEEDNDSTEDSDAADDVSYEDSSPSPRHKDRHKSSDVSGGKKSLETEIVSVKQEQIVDSEEDHPDTTVLELVEIADGSNGLGFKAFNVTSSSTGSLFTIGSPESASDVTSTTTTITAPDADKSPVRKKKSAFKVATVSPPRTRRSLRVSFKSPVKDEVTKTSVNHNEELSNGDAEDSDECDLAETYSIYVRNVLQLQPIPTQMALIKSINTTIGKFIKDLT